MRAAIHAVFCVCLIGTGGCIVSPAATDTDLDLGQGANTPDGRIHDAQHRSLDARTARDVPLTAVDVAAVPPPRDATALPDGTIEMDAAPPRDAVPDQDATRLSDVARPADMGKSMDAGGQPDLSPIIDAAPLRDVPIPRDVAPDRDAVLADAVQPDLGHVDMVVDAAPIEPHQPCPEMFPIELVPVAPGVGQPMALASNQVLIGSMVRIQGEVEAHLDADYDADVIEQIRAVAQTIEGPLLTGLRDNLQWPCLEGMVCMDDDERLAVVKTLLDLSERLVALRTAGVVPARDWNACVGTGAAFRLRSWLQRPRFLCGHADAEPEAGRLFQAIERWNRGALARVETYCDMVDLHNRCLAGHVLIMDEEGNLSRLLPTPRPAMCPPQE